MSCADAARAVGMERRARCDGVVQLDAEGRPG